MCIMLTNGRRFIILSFKNQQEIETPNYLHE
jgi:hypothetical protein